MSFRRRRPGAGVRRRRLWTTNLALAGGDGQERGVLRECYDDLHGGRGGGFGRNPERERRVRADSVSSPGTTWTCADAGPIGPNSAMAVAVPAVARAPLSATGHARRRTRRANDAERAGFMSGPQRLRPRTNGRDWLTGGTSPSPPSRTLVRRQRERRPAAEPGPRPTRRGPAAAICARAREPAKGTGTSGGRTGAQPGTAERRARLTSAHAVCSPR